MTIQEQTEELGPIERREMERCKQIDDRVNFHFERERKRISIEL